MKDFIDKASNFTVIKMYNKFQSSVLYPIFFAILCVFSSNSGHNMYITYMWIMTTLVVFGLIFNPDTKPFLAPFFMIFYALGSDTLYFINNPLQNILGSVAGSALPQMLVMAALILSSFFFRLYISGKLKDLFVQKNHFLFGLLMFSAALLTNGLFSKNTNFENFLYGALSVVGLTVAYLAIKATLMQTENTISYLCQTVTCFGYTVFAQILLLCLKLYKEDHLFKLSADGNIIGILETWMILPWGISNMIGAAVIMAVPAAIYLAYTQKHCVFYYLSAFLFVFSAFLTMGRTAMLIGALFLLIGIIMCSFFSKNSFMCHLVNIAGILISGILFLFFCIRLGYFSESFTTVLSFFRLDEIDAARTKLWKKGISDFRTSPLFGFGLINPNGIAANDYSNMYHNVIIQVLASLGIFGIITFAYHIKDLIAITFKKASKEKFILFLTPAMVLATSMFDNFFFYLNFQMIYAAFLAAIEFTNDEFNDQIITKE